METGPSKRDGISSYPHSAKNDNRDPTDKSIQKIMLAERGTSTVFQLIKNKVLLSY